MGVLAYTKSGAKSTASPKLDKNIFGVKSKNGELLKTVYSAYLANARATAAITKTRGKVRGGGRKPWRQKGTGRARAGSIRSPIWRGGGVIFGPVGNENYTHKVNKKAKLQALRQALSQVNHESRLKIIEAYPKLDGKTKDMIKFLGKIDANGKVLCVLDSSVKTTQAINNLPTVKHLNTKRLNVFDILNADTVIISTNAIAEITEWLSPNKPKAAKHE